jgi:ATP-dependent protease ClpP protease subunit
MAKHTGLTMARIQDDTDRRQSWDRGQAKDYGIIDDVLTQGPDR